ncbi:hypothetical protein GWK47_053350 [Chionoecetes opilio]|uniref:Uncharacterized protein n=1 Tax=Chionoecetes opilio TaxID=41210 RepID=A0A8J5CRA8_CHIOP|nr:hypothetical protein GWK47_053350 [Chionoecetes opilio]
MAASVVTQVCGAQVTLDPTRPPPPARHVKGAPQGVGHRTAHLNCHVHVSCRSE